MLETNVMPATATEMTVARKRERSSYRVSSCTVGDMDVLSGVLADTSSSLVLDDEPAMSFSWTVS